MVFEFTTEIDAPARAVFAFHEAPDAFARLTPPWENVRVVRGGGSIAIGTRVLIQVALGPVPLVWEAEHTQYEKDRVFVDVQRGGPFRRWEHTHRFEDLPGGRSRLIDHIECEFPLGALGRLVGGPMVRRRLERLFEFRHRVTREACARATKSA
jgi:hypothetical protein